MLHGSITKGPVYFMRNVSSWSECADKISQVCRYSGYTYTHAYMKACMAGWMHACTIYEHAYMRTCVRSFIHSFIHSCLRRGHLHEVINSCELTDQRMRTCTCVCVHGRLCTHARMYIIIIIIFIVIIIIKSICFYFSYYEYFILISVLKLKQDHFTTCWYV